jgi:hypothetical protein
MKSTKSVLTRSQTGDFDHNRWLFETKGTYGYGNAIWPKEGNFENKKGDDVVEPTELMSRPWRPLTRKLKIPAAVLSPYRYEAFCLRLSLSRYYFIICLNRYTYWWVSNDKIKDHQHFVVIAKVLPPQCCIYKYNA